jgi:uncharacterized protein YjbI with pentapeptide repeats
MDLESFLLGAVGATLTTATVLIAKRNSFIDALSKDATQMKEGLQLLASEEVEVRIGALHYLGLIANRTDSFYEPIMDTICAYVRRCAVDRGDVNLLDIEQANEALSFNTNTSTQTTDGAALSALEVAPDIDIALRIIGSRSNGSSLAKYSRNLSRCDLRRYVFHGDFSHVSFRLTKLDYALFDNTNLYSTKFWSTSLVGSKFLNCKAQEARFLRCSILGSKFEKCDLDLAIFRQTDLSAAELSNCSMRDSDLDW